MDATDIVSAAAALVAMAISVYMVRANRHKVNAEAADAISDAAVQLVEPLRCENLALREEVQKLRAEVASLRDDVEALSEQIKSLGHTPVRTNSQKPKIAAVSRGNGAKSRD